MVVLKIEFLIHPIKSPVSGKEYKDIFELLKNEYFKIFEFLNLGKDPIYLRIERSKNELTDHSDKLEWDVIAKEMTVNYIEYKIRKINKEI
ncbi:MAG: hypothetical protein ACTSU2_14580 [Promethearchaeota archaeon]